MLNQTAIELLAQLRDGSLSAVALMQATFEQIEKHNPKLNAIVALRDKLACMDDAREADKSSNTGRLHGLPMVIKDLAQTKGLVTSMGSPIFQHAIPEEDDVFVARIRAEGAIIIGKSNVPEFGFGSHSYNPVYGTTTNPFDNKLSAGGSSGGAAVALSTRMVALADGSDMMGSLRNPAGWNNVYGYRPSLGLVPNPAANDVFLSQMSTSGPMARNVQDISLLLEIMSGEHPNDPHSIGLCPFEGIAKNPQAKPLTIGWIGDWGGYYELESEIMTLCETALEQFNYLGYRVKKFTPDFNPKLLWESWTILRSWAIASSIGELYNDADIRNLLKPEAIWEIERGLKLTLGQVRIASEIRTNWLKYLNSLNDIDLFTLPTAQLFPFDAALNWPKQINQKQMDTYHRWMEIVIPAGLLGLPTLAIPVGFNKNNLPMGMQLFGRRSMDVQVLETGHIYHQATNWPAKNLSKPKYSPNYFY